jgi:hypothetical protein
MSASPPRADVPSLGNNVCLVPKADIPDEEDAAKPARGNGVWRGIWHATRRKQWEGIPDVCLGSEADVTIA